MTGVSKMIFKTLKISILTVALAAPALTIAALPDPDMEVTKGRTALLITDPQNDFLSPKGVAWGVVGKSVTDNNTVENIDSLFKAAKNNDIAGICIAALLLPDRPWLAF
jgi:hypothetical protein